MKLSVLNPGGSDPEQHFADGAGAPDDAAHPPVNYHAFAACTSGTFYRRDAAIPSGKGAVLLLIRRDLKAVRRSIVELRRAGKTILIAWKEAGAFQVAEQLAGANAWRLFREICVRCDAAIATTSELVPIFRSAGAPLVEFFPTPYPVEDARWDFSIPAVERSGIFVGTREFFTPSRQHLAALLSIKALAESMREPVTVFNEDGRRGRRLLAELSFSEGLLRVVNGRLPYPAYLRLMTGHRLVWQLDVSAVPGQVAGDALLCRIPCVGGNGTTERLVFPELCGHDRTSEQLADLAASLLEHPAEASSAVERSQAWARERLSFAAVALCLEKLFRRLGL